MLPNLPVLLCSLAYYHCLPLLQEADAASAQAKLVSLQGELGRLREAETELRQRLEAAEGAHLALAEQRSDLGGEQRDGAAPAADHPQPRSAAQQQQGAGAGAVRWKLAAGF